MDLVTKWIDSIQGGDEVKDAVKLTLLELLEVDAILKIDERDLKYKLSVGQFGVGLHNLELFPLRLVQNRWSIPPWLGSSSLKSKLVEIGLQRDRISELIGALIEARLDVDKAKDICVQVKQFLYGDGDYRIIGPVSNAWCRAWPRWAFYGSVSVLLLRSLYTVDYNIIYGLLINLKEAAGNFVRDYLISPLMEIWRTIRYRDGEVSVARAATLEADMATLERMIMEFNRETANGEGYSMLMSSYERDIKHPIKAALWGDLIRLILIQIQKTKVDVELAMASLDRLLQANELNFELIAILPVMALIWAGGRLTWDWWSRWRNQPSRQLRESLRHHGWRLSECLDYEATLSLGRLFVQSARLAEDCGEMAEKDLLIGNLLQLLRPDLTISDRRWIFGRLQLIISN